MWSADSVAAEAQIAWNLTFASINFNLIARDAHFEFTCESMDALLDATHMSPNVAMPLWTSKLRDLLLDAPDTLVELVTHRMKTLLDFMRMIPDLTIELRVMRLWNDAILRTILLVSWRRRWPANHIAAIARVVRHLTFELENLILHT